MESSYSSRSARPGRATPAELELALAESESKRRRLVHELAHARSHLLAAQSVARIGSWEVDLVTLAMRWSNETCRIFENGPDKSEATYQRFIDRVHPDDRAGMNAAFRGSMDGDGIHRFTHRVLTAAGHVRHVEERWLVVAQKGSRSRRAIGTCQEITERERMKAERERFFQLSLDLLCIAGFDGRLQQVNRAWSECLGWTAAELTRRPMDEFVHPEDRAATRETRARVIQGIPVRGFENRYRCKDGSYRWLSWSVHPVMESQQVFSVARDVTERRRLEEERRALERQFLRAQRMESVGTLAGGIAHDLNNLLSPIIMGVDLLRRFEPSADCAAVIETIEQSAKRGAELVKQVLSFARGVEGSRTPVDMGRIIREVRSIIEHTFPKNIEIQTEVAPDLRLVLADPTQLNQVLVNICVNARDAMPGGGHLAIVAQNIDVDAQYAAASDEVPPGRYVEIRVTDDGSGMEAALVDRIFEPFFTTKELGQGTGLGLSTALGIVRGYGGLLTVVSEPGRGSAFTILLPARAPAGAAGDLSETRPGAALRGDGELVLVVDDEAPILQITRRTLEDSGYRVVTAEDGAQAIGIFGTRMHEIALVLTDMIMPVMYGSALIEVLRRLDPAVRIIATSGLENKVMNARDASMIAVDFLPKPFSAATLLRALKAALGPNGGRGRSRPPI